MVTTPIPTSSVGDTAGKARVQFLDRKSDGFDVRMRWWSTVENFEPDNSRKVCNHKGSIGVDKRLDPKSKKIAITGHDGADVAQQELIACFDGTEAT